MRYRVEATPGPLIQTVEADDVEAAIKLALDNPNDWRKDRQVWAYNVTEVGC